MRNCVLKIQASFSNLKQKIMSILERSKIITPTVLQMENVECGAAALGIILGYYKKFIPLETLRIACGVSRDGSKAINIIKAARNFNMIAQGLRAEPETLHEVKFPCIVFWKFNHFVIVEDMTRQHVYINDPAFGRGRISFAEFNKAFTGVAIGLEPGPNFISDGQAPSLLRSLSERLKGKGAKNAILFLFLISLALVIPGILIPGFSKIFIDEILIKGLKNWMALLLIGLFMTAVLRSFMSGVQQYFVLRFHMKLMITQTAEFLWHIFKLPMSFFEHRYVGDITDRIESNESIATTVARDLSSSMVNVVSMVFFALVMLVYDWQLACIGIAAGALNAAILGVTLRQLSDLARTLAQDRGKLEGLEITGLHLIETLKSANSGLQFFKRWSGNHAKIIDSQQRLALYNQFLLSLPTLILLLSNILILGVGGYHVMKGYISIGTLVAFQTLFMSFQEPIDNLLDVGAALQSIKADFTRLNDVFQYEVDKRFKASEKAHLSLHHTRSEIEGENRNLLELKNITFGYSPLDPPLIQNFSLSLKVGGQIALVGATGSGKSTLAKLMSGLYSTWSGDICLQGYPITDLTPQALSRILAFVDQDIVLFEGTIRDNLTLWDNTILNSALKEALEDACAFDLIKKRKGGYDSRVLEFARNFSGGEQQRLEIARALVRKPQLVIMDEGTAALDAITEANIIKKLRDKGYSLIMVTHRLSSIRDSDEIIVLHQGQVTERGTHAELLNQQGHYTNLLRKAN